MLSYRRPVLSVCLSVCLSVYNVGALWPNGWMDQDETWHGGRPRPHCVRWGPSSPKGGWGVAQTPIFLLWPNSWMDRDTIWYEVGFCPSDIVLDVDLVSLPERGITAPTFWLMSMAK